MSAVACVVAAAVACGCGTHARVYRGDAGVERVDAWSDDDRPAHGDIRPVWSFSFPPVAAVARIAPSEFTDASVGGEPLAREDLRGSIVWGAKQCELRIALQRRVDSHWVPLSVNGDYDVGQPIPLPAPAGRESN